MQTSTPYAPCPRCGVPVSPDLFTGDPVQLADPVSGRLAWHAPLCPVPPPDAVPPGYVGAQVASSVFGRKRPKRRVSFIDPGLEAPTPFRLGGEGVR